MDVLREPAYVGVYEPEDLNLLKTVFTRLSAAGSFTFDDAKSRSVARAILTLYRHGVQDPEQLFHTLQVEPS